MIRIGASTACLYPLETEQALDVLLALGFRTLEVFVNTASEITPAFISAMRRKIEKADARIVSLHPFTSVAEPYLLFTEYERRFQDGLQAYDTLFRAAADLGASFLVMHGDRITTNGCLPEAKSFERYEAVYDLGRRHGVTLAQENVCRNRSNAPEYLLHMRQALGPKAHFVFDTKQVIRSHTTNEAVLAAMGDRIAHIHISDHNDQYDCLVPGEGCGDFGQVFSHLSSFGYDGAIVIELYRKNYKVPEDLVKGAKYLEKIVKEQRII